LWEERLAKAEHSEDIDAIRFLELRIRNILEFFVGPLKGGIVHEDVDSGQRIDGFPGNGFRFRRFANVAGKQDRLASGFDY
jgi:hypothetical protein